MFQKLKDGANKLKAKIGGDDLDEKLVEVVSEQNWQASTQQLHEIANAAYNYEKWQRISEFIWEKLKKSKSWKKILKTFNLIEFLLKNGPPSIISNFKYDLYQLRTFQSYSNYVDGVDKGEPIRERAKIVVGLLGNEDQLEEERVKAKNIRQKMSNVLGSGSNSGYGSSSSGSGYGGSGSNSGYGGYGSSEAKKNNKNDTYNYGNAVGHFGDYNYNKSTLDKYKDPKNDKPSGNSNDNKKEQKKPDIVVETKKPFEKIAGKLSKPGEKKQEKVETVTVQSTTTTTAAKSNNNQIFDIFGSEPTQPTKQPQSVSSPFNFIEPSKPVQPIQQTVQPQPIQQTQPHPIQQTQPVQQPYQQPQNTFVQQPQQVQQPFYPQQQPYPQQQFGQPQPNYPPNQFGGFNAYGQPNSYPQQQPQPFGYPPQQSFQPQNNSYGNQGYQNGGAMTQAPQYGGFQNQMYPNNAPVAQNMQQRPAQNMGITLSTGQKKEQDFGGFSSSTPSTASNVGWLSSTQKGLIDFSDFGSEIKKENKAANSKQPQISNNIQIDTWNW